MTVRQLCWALGAWAVIATVGTQADSATDPADLDAWVAHRPRPVLRTEYHPMVQRPLEYIGYSFDFPAEDLPLMRAAGANAVGAGEMWQPVRDPSQPYGVGVQPPAGAGEAAQSFVASEAFDGCAPHLATSMSTDSGCSWRLDRHGEATDGWTPVAEGVWPLVADNAWPEARFAPQPPGRYRLAIHRLTGTSISWWMRQDDPYADGQARHGTARLQKSDLELRIRVDGRWTDVIPEDSEHTSLPLGANPFARLRKHGMHASYQVGNWNNPGFNYYPEWFMDAFPEAIALDANGEPFLGGQMFERRLASPNIDTAVIVDGTRRFLQSRVAAYRDEPNLLFYTLGGESLYATYGSGRWADYSDNALAHFRAWLEAIRYEDLDALNAAWDADYAAFADVEPPRAPEDTQRWRDWLDFRFDAMGENAGWMYQAIRETDHDHLAFTCNHGTLFHDHSYAEMGADFEVFAAQSDGFETGQIIEDADPDYYNLLYVEGILGLGKPYAPVRLAYKKSDPAARGGGTSFTPEAVRRYGYETLGAGAWQLGFIQWDGTLPDGEWGVKGTPGEAATARFHKEIRGLWPLLDDLHPVHPGLGVYLSRPTWAQDGFLPAWHAFHKAAIRHQLPKAYVYDGMLRNRAADRFPTLVSIDNHRLTDEAAAGLLGYVDRGGRLIVVGALGTDAQAVALRDHAGVTWLPSLDAEGLAESLAPACRLVTLTSDHTVRRPLEMLTLHNHKIAFDLTTAATVGQTVRLAQDGLKRISISVPTYSQEAPNGFTLTARVGGPDGAVVATRDVPRGFGDNAWIDLDIPEPPAAGETLYVETTAPEDTPPLRLGWWSVWEDVFPDGEAYVDGKPAPGDRKMKLYFETPVPAERAMEAFVLSDGLNYGVVLVNTALDDATCRVDLTDMIGASPAASYSVAAKLQADAWTGEGLRGTVRVAAQDAEFLYTSAVCAPEVVAELEAAATARLTAWARADGLTGYTRRLRERLAATEDPAKRAALALAVCGQTGLRVEAPAETAPGAPLAATITVLDEKGEPMAADRVWAEVTPALGYMTELTQTDDGRYQLALDPAEITPLYHYARQTYEPFSGAARVRFAARAGELEASALHDVLIGGPREPAR